MRSNSRFRPRKDSFSEVLEDDTWFAIDEHLDQVRHSTVRGFRKSLSIKLAVWKVCKVWRHVSEKQTPLFGLNKHLSFVPGPMEILSDRSGDLAHGCATLRDPWTDPSINPSINPISCERQPIRARCPERYLTKLDHRH